MVLDPVRKEKWAALLSPVWWVTLWKKTFSLNYVFINHKPGELHSACSPNMSGCVVFSLSSHALFLSFFIHFSLIIFHFSPSLFFFPNVLLHLSDQLYLPLIFSFGFIVIFCCMSSFLLSYFVSFCFSLAHSIFQLLLLLTPMPPIWKHACAVLRFYSRFTLCPTFSFFHNKK